MLVQLLWLRYQGRWVMLSRMPIFHDDIISGCCFSIALLRSFFRAIAMGLLTIGNCSLRT